MIYLQLFISMVQVGLLSIGGGYVAIPLIKQQIVELRGWLTLAEFADVVTIAEITPGPIAINAATFVGTKVAGLLGACVATLACVLPSCVIVILLARLYYKYRQLNAIQYALSGLRPAVVAMIASAGLGIIVLAFFREGVVSLAAGDIRWLSTVLFALGLIAIRKFRASPMLVILGTGLIGLIAFAAAGV